MAGAFRARKLHESSTGFLRSLPTVAARCRFGAMNSSTRALRTKRHMPSRPREWIASWNISLPSRPASPIDPPAVKLDSVVVEDIDAHLAGDAAGARGVTAAQHHLEAPRRLRHRVVGERHVDDAALLARREALDACAEV